MTRTELLVVGAGPAGLAAAIEAARAGIEVLVIDDNARAGGQIYREPPPQLGTDPSRERKRDFRDGRALLDDALGAGVQFRFGCTAWSMFDLGIIDVFDASVAGRIHASKIVLATGAHDRPAPLPGWTLPGVFTIGGAQALLKGQRILPGQRMVLAGAGPLLLVVASQLAEAGVDIVAVAEPVPGWTALSVLPSLLREMPLLTDGLRYRASLLRRGVPWMSRTILTRIEGDSAVSGAVVARAGRDWRPIAGTEQRFEVDAVAVGYGLIPSTELPRLCGCAMTFDPTASTWLPRRDQNYESTVPGVFIVGDGAGVAGVVVAVEEGRVAGLTAARQLGKLSAVDAARLAQPHRNRLASLETLRRAMDRAYSLRPGLFDLTEPSTIACRCEEVTFDDLAQAARDGADSPAMLKSFTRCGMGACQGRMCATTTTEWLAKRAGDAVGSLPLLPAAPPAKAVVTLGALARE